MLPVINPARAFIVTLYVNSKGWLQADLRDRSGKLWSSATGGTYSDATRKIETAAFNFGGTIVEWRDA